MAQTKDKPNQPANQPLAGTVISPGGSETPASRPEPAPPAALPAEPSIQAVAAPSQPDLPAEEPTGKQEAAPAADDGQAVTWTASEFVAHDKSAGWYTALAVGTLLLAGGIYLLTRDFISTGVIVVAGILLGVYAGHQPRQLEYSVSHHGFTVGQKQFSYEEFRWFSIAPEGAFSSLVFMPLKRFAATTTIYYPPEAEERILTIITNHLPMEEHRSDAVDKLLRRIRF